MAFSRAEEFNTWDVSKDKDPEDIGQDDVEPSVCDWVGTDDDWICESICDSVRPQPSVLSGSEDWFCRVNSLGESVSSSSLAISVLSVISEFGAIGPVQPIESDKLPRPE